MKTNRIFLSAMIALGTTSMGLIGGCADEYGGSVQAGYVDYTPGYYYDDAYIDVYGRSYPRRYYYYDGHRWADRDDIPHGITAQHRHEREEREERTRREHEHHDERHDDHHDDRHDR